MSVVLFRRMNNGCSCSVSQTLEQTVPICSYLNVAFFKKRKKINNKEKDLALEPVA